MWGSGLSICVTGYDPAFKAKIQRRVERVGARCGLPNAQQLRRALLSPPERIHTRCARTRLATCETLTVRQVLRMTAQLILVGCRYCPSLSKAATHLVVSPSALNPPSDKLTAAARQCASGAWSLRIVQAEWLKACLVQRHLCDCGPYLLNKALLAAPGQPVPAAGARERAPLKALDANRPLAGANTDSGKSVTLPHTVHTPPPPAHAERGAARSSPPSAAQHAGCSAAEPPVVCHETPQRKTVCPIPCGAQGNACPSIAHAADVAGAHGLSDGPAAEAADQQRKRPLSSATAPHAEARRSATEVCVLLPRAWCASTGDGDAQASVKTCLVLRVRPAHGRRGLHRRSGARGPDIMLCGSALHTEGSLSASLCRCHTW